MKSITIHKINNDLEKKLRDKSKEFGLSQNRTVKKILEDSLSNGINKRSEEFKDLFGKWTEEDENLFNKATEDFAKIDAEDWR